jgi:hypothetical protein
LHRPTSSSLLASPAIFRHSRLPHGESRRELQRGRDVCGHQSIATTASAKLELDALATVALPWEEDLMPADFLIPTGGLPEFARSPRLPDARRDSAPSGVRRVCQNPTDHRSDPCPHGA